MTTAWKIVDENGDDVMTAEFVTRQAQLERTTPRRVAQREAKMLVNTEAGDAPVFAVPAEPHPWHRTSSPICSCPDCRNA